ncbi:hypothetical protein ACHAWF_008569 [Thalassiosira exigua]
MAMGQGGRGGSGGGGGGTRRAAAAAAPASSRARFFASSAPPSVAAAVLLAAAAATSLASLALLLRGLLFAGPEFYDGVECEMTWSAYRFLPMRVLPLTPPSSAAPPASPPPPSADAGTRGRERYRLLKFVDVRDPRARRLLETSGSMAEDARSERRPRRRKFDLDVSNGSSGEGGGEGRPLEAADGWCPPPGERGGGEGRSNNRGHPVLYVPGHWGSYSQARSLGAHGSGWTRRGMAREEEGRIRERLRTGRGMHDGDVGGPGDDSEADFASWWEASHERDLEGFVMDVYTLDFDEEGAALHPSTLLRQAEFFARAAETIADGCGLSVEGARTGGGGRRRRGVTVVAHSLGAWVVRVALRMHPRLAAEGGVRNVVALASPLRSVPYAVDAGVHEIARRVNDRSEGEGDVALISISGGLRDETIPPEACEVPPPSPEGADGSASRAFLAPFASHDASLDEDHYGMDHRAVVWCHELLSVVRTVAFSLAVAADRGLNATERADAVEGMIVRRTAGEPPSASGGASSGGSNFDRYREGVRAQHARLLRREGRWKATSIQLAAPYRLNSLLKLCVVAASWHAIATSFRPDSGRPHGPVRRLAYGVLAVPILVTLVVWTRRSEGPSRACFGHECHLLLGTAFALAQLATLAHFILAHGLFALVAAVRKSDFPSGRTTPPSRWSFGVVLSSLCDRNLRFFASVSFPSTAAVCMGINAFNGDFEDMAWNGTTVAACCFISSLLFLAFKLLCLMCLPQRANSATQRSDLLVLLLSLAKATIGKAVYALALTTRQGQAGLNSYDDFLAAMHSAVGAIGGRHNEMLACAAATLIPTLIAALALETHKDMARNAMSRWDNTKRAPENGNSSGKGAAEVNSLDKLLAKYREPTPLIALRLILACWCTWNAFVNLPEDDRLLPIHASIMLVGTYLKSRCFSMEAVDVCTAVSNDDLSLQCDFQSSHTKNE